MMTQPLFPLPPEVSRVILGGAPPIDQPGLHLTTLEMAQDFALHYGYDVSIPHHRDHIVKVYEDALSFLRDVILIDTQTRIPAEFADLQDPLLLMVWASERPRDLRAKWSCAILRIMHTLFHVDNILFTRFMPEIQKQVFDRYERYLVPTSDGKWLLKGHYEVPLLTFSRKESKDRVSLLLKLLHKPENVAETIYDMIGIRLVAEDLIGVLMTIRFLLDHHILMAAHIKPSRSRNLMVNTEALDQWMAQIPKGYTLEQLSPEDRTALANALTLRDGSTNGNPFSSSSYSAVQFTARTLVRLPNTAHTALNVVQSRLEDMGKAELGDLLHIPELIQKQEEFTFFFAHEVQIMEKTGFDSIASGPASHTEYKLRQREAARRRVLQGIVAQEAPC